MTPHVDGRPRISGRAIWAHVRSGLIVLLSACAPGRCPFELADNLQCPRQEGVLLPPSLQLEVGETDTIEANFYNVSDATQSPCIINIRDLTWRIDNPQVVAIRSTTPSQRDNTHTTLWGFAVVQGVASGGPVNITADLENRDTLTAAGTITVAPAPVSIDIASPSTFVYVGSTISLTAIVRDANRNPVAGRTIQWTGTNAAATVDQSTGQVTGRNAGQVNVTATDARSGLSATITLEVRVPPPATVEVSPSLARIGIGSQLQLVVILRAGDNSVIPLAGRDVEWSNDNAAAVSIAENADQSVTVTARTIGSARVTATVEGTSGFSVLFIDPAIDRIVISPTTAQLQVGGTVTLTATPFDAAGNALPSHVMSWLSSSSNIASVTPINPLSPSTATVAGHAVGAAVITASTGGRSATAAVSVGTPLVAVSRVSISPSSANVQVGQSAQMTARTYGGTPEVELLNRSVVWQVVNPNVAQLSATAGVSPAQVAVTGVAAGSTTLRATSEGVSGTSPITVTAPTPPLLPPRFAFAIADRPADSSPYSANSAFTHNSRGGPITIARQNVGEYIVTFPGQRAVGSEVETIFVTALGQTAVYCVIASWTPVGQDLAAHVRCLRRGAILNDTPFSIMLLGNDALSGRFGFAYANSVAMMYAPANAFNSAGLPVTVERFERGGYDLTFPALTGPGLDAVILTAAGTGQQTCSVWTRLSGTILRVSCFDSFMDGAAADATFTAARMSAGRVGKRAAGAYIDAAGVAGTVTLSAADRFTTGSGVQVRQQGTGNYEVTFLGLAPAGAGSALGIQVVNRADPIVDGEDARAQAFCTIGGPPTTRSSDLVVQVRCFSAGGTPDDESFYIVIIE